MITRTRWWLRASDSTAEIGEQPLLLGRSSTCHIAFPEDPLASRVHAKLWHEGTGVMVQDLDSTNGTFVNEHRITSPQLLGSGARLRIGSQLFWLHAGESAPRGVRNASTVGDLPAHLREAAEGETIAPTDTTSVFAMVAPMVEAAFSSGNVNEALRILEPCLDAVVTEARRGDQGDPEVLSRAAEYALRLAEATGHGAWLDYLVELAEKSGVSPPRTVRQRIAQVAANLDGATRNWQPLSAP
ncbi:MAG: FHA domain-containing protein [Myxococcales bacterium]|nr:FHA domain-containing protein [Myxococcales bacterium]MCB9578941.1 FHA domain-containing protein [Polyangiaceae bacterium]